MVRLLIPNYFLVLFYSIDLQKCKHSEKVKNTAFWQHLSISPAAETSMLQLTVLEGISSLALLSRHSANHFVSWRYKQTHYKGALRKYLNFNTAGDNREHRYMGQRESVSRNGYDRSVAHFDSPFFCNHYVSVVEKKKIVQFEVFLYCTVHRQDFL